MTDIEVNDHSQTNEIDVDNEESKILSIPDELPVLPLRNLVMLPYTVASISVGQMSSLGLLESVIEDEKLVAIVAYKDSKIKTPKPEQLYTYGCVAQILRARPSHNGSINVLLQGLNKFKIEEWTRQEPYLQARLTIINDIELEKDDIEAEAIRNNLLELFTRLVSMLSFLSEDLLHSVAETQDYRHLIYLISSSMQLDVVNAQEILEQDDLLKKMHKLTELLDHEIQVMELGKKIHHEAQGEMEKAQREYVLREQIKAIQRELGEMINRQSLQFFSVLPFLQSVP